MNNIFHPFSVSFSCLDELCEAWIFRFKWKNTLTSLSDSEYSKNRILLLLEEESNRSLNPLRKFLHLASTKYTNADIIYEKKLQSLYSFLNLSKLAVIFFLSYQCLILVFVSLILSKRFVPWAAAGCGKWELGKRYEWTGEMGSAKMNTCSWKSAAGGTVIVSCEEKKKKAEIEGEINSTKWIVSIF